MQRTTISVLVILSSFAFASQAMSQGGSGVGSPPKLFRDETLNKTKASTTAYYAIPFPACLYYIDPDGQYGYGTPGGHNHYSGGWVNWDHWAGGYCGIQHSFPYNENPNIRTECTLFTIVGPGPNEAPQLAENQYLIYRTYTAPCSDQQDREQKNFEFTLELGDYMGRTDGLYKVLDPGRDQGKYQLWDDGITVQDFQVPASCPPMVVKVKENGPYSSECANEVHFSIDPIEVRINCNVDPMEFAAYSIAAHYEIVSPPPDKRGGLILQDELVYVGNNTNINIGRAVLRIGPEAQTGKATIIATYSGCSSCKSEPITLEIKGKDDKGAGGCKTCQSDSPLDGGAKLASAMMWFSLGKTWDGRNAGRILFEESTAGPNFATPAVLGYTPEVNNGGKVVRDENGVLRQILVETGLVDIVVTRDGATQQVDGYEIRHYPYAQVTNPDCNRLFEFTGSADVYWKLTNPDFATPGQYNRLNAKKILSNGLVQAEYAFTYAEDGGKSSWTLETPNGTETRVEKQEREGNIRTYTIQEGGDLVYQETEEWGRPYTDDELISNYSRCRNGYVTTTDEFDNIIPVLDEDGNLIPTYDEACLAAARIAWQNLMPSDVLLKKTVSASPNPDLVTEYDYWLSGNSPGRLKSVKYPDGAWICYGYLDDGRVSITTSSWQDSDGNDDEVAEYPSDTAYHSKMFDYGPLGRAPQCTDPTTLVQFHDYCFVQNIRPWEKVGTQDCYLRDEQDAPVCMTTDKFRESYSSVNIANYYRAILPEQKAAFDASVEAWWDYALGLGFQAVGSYDTIWRRYGSLIAIHEKKLSAYSDTDKREVTYTIFMPGDDDKVESVQYPDGRLDSYTYERGDYIEVGEGGVMGVFSIDSTGPGMRTTVTHGIVGDENKAGIPGKTTREISIVTGGKTRLQITEAYVGGGYVCIDWTERRYDAIGRITGEYRSNGTKVTTAYDETNCCRTRIVTDETGMTTTYVNDVLGNPKSVTKASIPAASGYPEQPAITTTYTTTTSAAGRVSTTTTTATGMPNSLTTSSVSDMAGRAISSVDAAGLETRYKYTMSSGGGRIVTVIGPGDTDASPTSVTEYFRSGSIKSVTGAGQTGQFYSYGSGGSFDPNEEWVYQWVKVSTGSSNSLRYTQTWTDMFGRTIREERPGYSESGAEVKIASIREYYAKSDLGMLPGASLGKLKCVRTTVGGTPAQGIPTQWYWYDSLGNIVYSGSDIDGADGLQLASDRVTATDSCFESFGGQWCQVTRTWAYPDTGSSTPVQTGTSWQQLTGLSEAMVSASGSQDIFGNVTTQMTGLGTITVDNIDQPGKLVTQTSALSGSTIPPAVSVSRGGLLQTSTTSAGITYQYGYDGFGRQVSMKDPRMTASSTTHYEQGAGGRDLGRVDWVADAAGNTTKYLYYGQGEYGAGRVKAVINVVEGGAEEKTFYAYNAHGQVEYVWGSATQPLWMEFDPVYGERVKLHTYQQEDLIWSANAWPGSSADIGNVTTWIYHPATGLLTAKRNADYSPSTPNEVTYTYTAVGQLKTRKWARNIVTTYAYFGEQSGELNTGELKSVTYSDGVTPNVAFAYNRLGRQLSVQDGVGTRTFAYDPATLRQLTETFTGGLFDGQVITQKYELSQVGAIGRWTGVQVGTSADPDALYAAGYGYEAATGRMNRVTGPGLPTGSQGTQGPGAFYSYLSNSNLIEKLEIKDAGGNVKAWTKKEFEGNRNLLTQVNNYWGNGMTNLVSGYGYTNDKLARRTNVAYSGEAFTPVGQSFEYNSRNELTVSTRGSTSKWEYTYDAIGNRLWQEFNDANRQYYCSNALNQYTKRDDSDAVCTVTNPDEAFSYDLDGNMTQVGSANGLPAQTYTWDAENRLIAVTPTSPANGDKKVSFVYDYRGRRVQKRVEAFNAGTWQFVEQRLFVWNGWLMLAELADGVNSQSQSFHQERKYAWGLDLSNSLSNAGGIGGLLAMQDAMTIAGTGTSIGDYLFSYDANGNVGQLLNLAASTVGDAMVARYEYDPYGNLSFSDGSYALSNPFRSSTKYFDSETGLRYYGYRYYLPRLGRWLNRDPIEEKGFRVLTPDTLHSLPIMGANPILIASSDYGFSSRNLSIRVFGRNEENLYLFVLNNPVIFADRLGLDILLETGNNLPVYWYWPFNKLNNLVHQSVCVDEWDRTKRGCTEQNKWECCKKGTRCFTFSKLGGLAGWSYPKFSLTWLGWSGYWVASTGDTLWGIIEEVPRVPGSTAVNRHSTSMKQDSNWLIYMLLKRVGLEDSYTIAGHNCRLYSQLEFEDAPLHW